MPGLSSFTPSAAAKLVSILALRGRASSDESDFAISPQSFETSARASSDESDFAISPQSFETWARASSDESAFIPRSAAHHGYSWRERDWRLAHAGFSDRGRILAKTRIGTSADKGNRELDSLIRVHSYPFAVQLLHLFVSIRGSPSTSLLIRGCTIFVVRLSRRMK
jgi:hypothetical protein